MRVDGLIFADESLIAQIKKDQGPEQVANVATLRVFKSQPGDARHPLGYGFAIGGVAATDPEEGGDFPGGVGYDINCGVRLLRTDPTWRRSNRGFASSSTSYFGRFPQGSASGAGSCSISRSSAG